MKSLKTLIIFSLFFSLNNIYCAENKLTPSKEDLKLQFDNLLSHKLTNKEKRELQGTLERFLGNTEKQKKLISQLKYAQNRYTELIRQKQLLCCDNFDDMDDEEEKEYYNILRELSALEKRIKLLKSE